MIFYRQTCFPVKPEQMFQISIRKIIKLVGKIQGNISSLNYRLKGHIKYEDHDELVGDVGYVGDDVVEDKEEGGKVVGEMVV